MTITARIIADSYNRGSNARLTTFVVKYPAMVHNEHLRHRIKSFSVASSRAIKFEQQVQAVLDDPAMPLVWGSSQSGMQAGEELTGERLEEAKRRWLVGRDGAVDTAIALHTCGLHKQHAVRGLQAYQHIEVIITATDYANFYKLRRDAMAQPEIHALADAMYEVHKASVPLCRDASPGIRRWHLPLVDDDERATLDEMYKQEGQPLEYQHPAIKVSVGRCARISYLTHEGKRDFKADIDLHDRLMSNNHWSPFEHVACPGGSARYGNFFGWMQYRKQLQNEHPYFPGQTFPDEDIDSAKPYEY